VELALEVGEYTFELGLATIDPISYDHCYEMMHEELFSKIIRICHVPNAGVISVGLRNFVGKGPQLTHHGIANLSGACEINLVEKLI
jgi:lipopolysaccharide transport system ATP-binding protein